MIYVLFDGHCGFCRRSVKALVSLDWLHRLSLVDMHDGPARMRVAPEIPLEELDKALHIKLPDGRSFKGYSAFRHMTWSLPPLWIVAPFLYIPGAKFLGDRVYQKIADSRSRCTHESCGI